jgi:hypothetical protein
MRQMTVILAVAMLASTTSAFAMDDMKMGQPMDMASMMKMMDTNNDGMVSKEEFMKHHEMMFDKMKKNKMGMIDMKDMPMMHMGMSKDMKMTKDQMKKENMSKQITTDRKN